MKYLSLLTWVTQFGFSILFPTCSMLLLAYWLQNRFGMGPWIMILLGIIGVFTSISTAKSCIRSLIKASNKIKLSKFLFKLSPKLLNSHDSIYVDDFGGVDVDL